MIHDNNDLENKIRIYRDSNYSKRQLRGMIFWREFIKNVSEQLGESYLLPIHIRIQAYCLGFIDTSYLNMLNEIQFDECGTPNSSSFFGTSSKIYRSDIRPLFSEDAILSREKVLEKVDLTPKQKKYLKRNTKGTISVEEVIKEYAVRVAFAKLSGQGKLYYTPERFDYVLSQI